jgi:adenosine deaminase
LLTRAFDYTLEDLQQFQLNAAESTFQSLEAREELIEQVLRGFKKAGL